jgi:hypothetical protein
VHTDPICPTTKANSTNARDWRYYGLVLAVLCMLAVAAGAQTPCTAKPQFNLSLYYGGQQVTINTSGTNSTTLHPCAWADAVTTNDELTAFLACPLTTTGPIALCYYAGRPGAPYSTPSCTLSQGGNAAECSCYEIDSSTGGSNAPIYSYVEITAILNQAVYNEAVIECGVNGNGGNYSNGCLSLFDVQQNNPKKKTSAPFCATLNKANTKLMPPLTGPIFPGADLISDFSQIQVPQLPPPPPGNTGSFSQTCPVSGMGTPPYAACMTAPCKLTNKTDPTTGWPLAKCTCPIFNGVNQVGNPQIGSSPSNSACTPNPYVWSSAYIGAN